MSRSHFTETGKSKSEPKISDRLKQELLVQRLFYRYSREKRKDHPGVQTKSEDLVNDQISLEEHMDPFTGSRQK
jgi:hypothetical protein